MESLFADPTVEAAALHVLIAVAQLVLIVAPLMLKKLSPPAARS